VTLAVVGLPDVGGAQDTHYWNSQYGPRAILLGGAVIGSIGDMSATYYNPGALGYVENPELLLSANVYQTQTLTIRDGAGEGIDLTTSDFNILPNMLAGAFRKSWLGKNKFAYSLLTRYRFRAEVEGARIARGDFLPTPGEEDFAGALAFSNEGSELWAGLTWSRGFGSQLGLGVTQYVSIRNQSQVDRIFAQALPDSGDMALVFDVDNFSSTVYSLLWKAGIGFDYQKLTAGITLTTPNVRLTGSGEAGLNTTIVEIDIDDDGIPDDAFETDVQTDVTANYKIPLSIGVGAALHLDQTRIHAAAEWFDGVDTYDVLELETFVSQATGETLQRSLRQKLDSVVNFALGVEHRFGESFVGYLSFTSDVSAFNAESDVSATGFDVYHATGGGTFKVGRSNLTLGISYAWGSEKILQRIDLNPGEEDPVIDPSDQVELDFSRATFIIGFSVAI
jgi:hypothetical protein